MNKRQIEILIDLLERDNYISAAKLAKKHQVSTKTIYTDLDVLEEDLLQKQLKLIKIPRHGLIIEGDLIVKHQLLVTVRNHLSTSLLPSDYSQREGHYLRKLLLENDNCSILDLAMDFFLSETSVRRDLDRLEKLVSDHHLALIKEHGCVSIQGDEGKIRSFLRSYLLDHYQLMPGALSASQELSTMFRECDLTQLDKKIQELKALFAISIPQHLEIYVMLDLVINSYRIKNNHYLRAVDVSIEDDLHFIEVYPLASELLSASLDLPVDLLSDDEIKQICLTILSLGYIPMASDNQEFKRLTTDLIDKVSELSGIDFSQDSYLREMINKHMRPMIYRLKNKITIENQTTEEIKKRYSILFNIVWLASKIVTDSYHIDFLDSEIAFLTIYFQIAVEKIEKPLEIVIVCPHGLATSELIFNTLRRLISPYDHLKKIDFSDVTDELVQDVDMIISSVELRQLSCNYILVSPVPSQFEVDKIQNFYHSLTDGNRKILSVVKDKQSINQSMVCDLIQNHIYLNQDCKTYDQVIQFLVNQDSSSELQTAYIDSIFQRENLGSTSVYTGIALPHANPRTVGKSGLKLLTLKQPIVWGANKVKVVMLISIKEGEEELYKDALIYLYSKIDDQHFIDQLATATTTQEFMTRLFREE
ncbi:transcription antiterminator [Streptococcus iniae]|uniref:BglG family transcription antiterminator n=1 Tax=Streptococcus iniae TaxID=1346 RepID=UPI0008DA6E57|nr:PTS sugar transporter subunit IIA [Streptococcus iniae]OHX27070.1 sugar lyase [Streptococcus iniae]RLV28546.1 transcription antiterminator [Streptococcus iniae]